MKDFVRALRGPTIRALLRRMAVAAAVLAVALVGIRGVGQHIAASRYHQAAVTEVDRIRPAVALRTTVMNAQAAIPAYGATLWPDYREAWAEAYGNFVRQLSRLRATNRDAPEIERSLARIAALSRAWVRADSRAVSLIGSLRRSRGIRLARGAANPLLREHKALMDLLDARRLAALRAADRWASISYWLSTAAIAFGGLVVMLFAALITRRVLRPLGALQDAAARIGHGMPGAVELPRRPDEIHDLAVAFTTMERDLGAARRQLEARAAELEQANRLKSELVANVSHELRTPLSAIIGYSQLLLDESYASLGERERGDLTTVLTSAEHLLVVINDLLDVSRIEAGRLEIRPLVTDLREVARQACQAVERQARDKGLALECRMPDEPVWAFCDPDRLRQVLLNLVGNAVKFTYEGSVTLEAASDGDWAEVTVADTGVGIPDDQLPRIWEQFHQVDGSLTRRAGGTGLGLAITRQLVLAHGGTIGCRSEVGAGSTFTVRLPAHERAAEEAPTRGDAHLVDF